MRILILLATMVLALCAPAHAGLFDGFTDKELRGKKAIGWAEYVRVKDTGMTMKARIDTGALLSSIHARTLKIAKPKEKGDPEIITFEVYNDKETKTLKRKLVRWVRIKRKGSTGYIDRPVVMLDMCIAGKRVEGEVNLANRSRFIYPLLIGRNILRKANFVVDSKNRYTHKPECK